MPLLESLRRGAFRPGAGFVFLLWAALAALPPLMASAQEPVPVLLQLDEDVLAEGHPLSGSLTGDWTDKTVRLLWVDESGRVVSQAEPRPSRQPGDVLHFTLANPGARGTTHRVIAVVQTPGKDKRTPAGWQIVSKTSFRTIPARTVTTFPIFVPGAERGPSPEGLSMGPILSLGALAKTPFLPPSCPILIAADIPLRSPIHPHTLKEWETEGWRFMADRKPLVRTPDLFDGPGWDRLRADMTAAVRQAKPFGPTAYALGSNPSLGLGRTPYEIGPDALTLEIFRAWLRKRYEDLNALNRQWGTTFERWDDVAPLTTDQVKAANDPRYAEWLNLVMQGDPEKKLPRREDRPFFAADLKTMPAPGTENFSSWCDFHAFLDFSFARMIGEVRAAMHEADEQAQAGYLNPLPPSPWGGQDLYELARVLDWAALPPDPVLSLMLQSFRPDAPQYFLVQNAGPSQQELWDGWIDGLSGLTVAGQGKPAADGLPQETLRELSKLTPYREGFQTATDAVAIYYSPRSVAVHWMLDSQLDGSDWPRRGTDGTLSDTPWLNWCAWVSLLRDLGVSPRFVAPAQLIAGQVNAKILILPKVIALSTREAEAIRNFTLYGGVVIADSQCGLFDEHGRRRAMPRGGGAVGLLDADFGLIREDQWAHELNGSFRGDAAAARVSLLDPAKVGAMGPSSDELRVNEPGVRATGAWCFGRSSAGTSAVLTRNGGTGRFIYLNLAIQDYPELRLKTDPDFQFAGMDAHQYTRLFGTPTGGEALRVLVGDMIAQTIGEPSVLVRDGQGLPLRGVTARRWEGHDRVLIALQPPASGWVQAPPDRIASPWGPEEGEAEEKAADTPESSIQVHYRQPMHWYDLRKGIPLGKGAQCTVAVTGAEPILLAGMPCKLERIRTRTRRLDRTGLFSVELNAETGEHQGDHKNGPLLLTTELLAPDGSVIPGYTRQLVLSDKSFSTTIALGLNDPPGPYRWQVRDQATGVVGEAHLLKEESLYQELFPPVTTARNAVATETKK